MTPMSFVSGRGGKGVIPKPEVGGVQGVLARTFAWVENFRRPAVRYERMAKMHEAFSIGPYPDSPTGAFEMTSSWTSQPDL